MEPRESAADAGQTRHAATAVFGTTGDSPRIPPRRRWRDGSAGGSPLGVAILASTLACQGQALDPQVFGTPDRPVGFDPAPFPLLGVPLDLRRARVSLEATSRLPTASILGSPATGSCRTAWRFRSLGGVVTNDLLHGETGIGTRLMPTEFTDAAFWGVGNVDRKVRSSMRVR